MVALGGSPYIVRSVVIAVSIQNNGQAVEEVNVPENWSPLHPVLGIPYNKPIAKQVLAFTVYLKVNLHLPILYNSRLQIKKNR